MFDFIGIGPMELLLLLVLQLLQVLQLLWYDLKQLKNLLQRLCAELTHTGRPARRDAHGRVSVELLEGNRIDVESLCPV